MKKIALLLLLIVAAFTSFSQPLIPLLSVQDKDTVFCFTIPQSKIIAAHLQYCLYCDSVLKQADYEVGIAYQLLNVRDSSLAVLQTKTQNQECQIFDKGSQVEILNYSIKQKIKQIRRERIQKGVIVVSAIILASAFLLK